MPTFQEQPVTCRQLITDPNCIINPEWVENALIEWIHDNLNEFFAVNPHLRYKVSHSLCCYCDCPIPPEERAMCRSLLTDPSCTINPEWTESALVNWICNHMNEFLAVNPHLCQKAARSRGWFYHMAPVVPITDENESLLKMILEECYSSQMHVLCDRLLQHGKIDLVADIAPWKFMRCDEWLYKYIDRLGKESLIKILQKIPRREYISSKKTILAIIKRLVINELMMAVELGGGEIIQRMTKECYNLSSVARIVVAPLKRLQIHVTSVVTHYCQVMLIKRLLRHIVSAIAHCRQWRMSPVQEIVGNKLAARQKER